MSRCAKKQPPLQSLITDGNYWRDPSGGRRAGRVGAGHAILQDPSIGTHPSPVRSANPPELAVAVRHGPCKLPRLPLGLRSARPARAPEPAESIVSGRPWAMVQSQRQRCGVASTVTQSHRIHGKRRTSLVWSAHHSVPSQFADRHGHRHGGRNPPPRRQSAGE